jgi:hypothetical protein
MIEKIIEKALKDLESEEHPTAPSPPVSGVAFADHPPPTRKGGQQNETYGEGTVGLGGGEDWRDKQGNIDINEYKNGEGTIQKQKTAREKTTVKSGLKLIDGNSARNYENVARNLKAKALEEEPYKRDPRLWLSEPQPRACAFFENLKWLNSEEAVAYLRLPSLGALRNLVYRRQIPCTKLGRLLRFDREELDRFLMSQTRHRRIAI